MALHLSVHHGLPYLLVEAAGPANLADHFGVVDLVAAICAGSGYRRALIDLLELQPSMTFTEHLQLGSHVAEKFRALDRVATVVTPQVRKGASEKAAQKLGAHLQTFTGLDEALAWITR